MMITVSYCSNVNSKSDVAFTTFDIPGMSSIVPEYRNLGNNVCIAIDESDDVIIDNVFHITLDVGIRKLGSQHSQFDIKYESISCIICTQSSGVFKLKIKPNLKEFFLGLLLIYPRY